MHLVRNHLRFKPFRTFLYKTRGTSIRSWFGDKTVKAFTLGLSIVINVNVSLNQSIGGSTPVDIQLTQGSAQANIVVGSFFFLNQKYASQDL
jgi:hypothetical protein